jgi:anti-sigma B factor antagonist
MTCDQPSEQLLSLSVDQMDKRATVILSGELDLSNTQIVYEQFRVLVDDGIAELICDVADLTFVDSTGLSVFLSAQKRLTEAGGTFVLRSPSPPVARMFEIAGVLEHLNVETDLPSVD